MDFDPSDDQRLLVESVTRLLADNYSFAQRKTYLAKPEGFSSDMWSKFAELGLLGLSFAEEYGGFGGGAQGGMLVMQGLGRGVARRGYATRDETRAADVSLSNVPVADTDVLGEVGKGLAIVEKIVEACIAATAAETVGAMETMNEMTLEYSKTRVQFGQPIGSYQVVQHRLADMFMAQEQGRSMAMLATMSVDNTDD